MNFFLPHTTEQVKLRCTLYACRRVRALVHIRACILWMYTIASITTCVQWENGLIQLRMYCASLSYNYMYTVGK